VTIRDLLPGENAALVANTLRLTVTPSSVPLVMVLLTAKDQIHPAAGSDRHPGAAGSQRHPGVVPVVGTDLPVRLDALDPQVARCLLVGHGPWIGTPSVQVQDGDAVALRFTPPVPLPGGAAVLVEFYRRAERWKLRAIGQSYAGGLAEFGRLHGVRLPGVQMPGDQLPADGAAQSGPESPEQPPNPLGGKESAEAVVRQLAGIWEDASRSAGSFAESVRFAESGRDIALEELVADVAARSPDHPGRRAAEQKYQQVIDAASERRLSDLDQLADELARLEKTLPAPLARWDARVWREPIQPDGVGIFRIGEITRQDSRALRIPMVQAIAAPGGIWLITPGNRIEQRAVNLLHRIFAAAPAGRLVELIAAEPSPGEPLELPGSCTPADRESRLTSLALQVDLLDMAASNGARAPIPADLPSVVVLPWQAAGMSGGELAALEKLAVAGPGFGLQVVYIGGQEDLELSGLRYPPRPVPTVPATTRDPWIGQHWDFEPDTGVMDADIGRRVRERMRAPHPG